MAVAALVGSSGGDEDQVIAALLSGANNDGVLSDNAPTDIRTQIRDAFGARVLEIVEACSDVAERPGVRWGDQNAAYLERIAELADDSPVLLVALCDALCGARGILRDLRELPEPPWGRLEGKHAGTLWRFNALAGIFEEKTPGHLARELRRVVEGLQSEGGVPEMLEPAEADNALLVELLEAQLPDGWQVLDAEDYLLVDIPGYRGYASFLAEIEPSELAVHTWLYVVLDETEAEVISEAAATAFQKRAAKLFEKMQAMLSAQGFESAPEQRFESFVDPVRMECSQEMVRPCASLDEVVGVVELLYQLSVEGKLGACIDFGE